MSPERRRTARLIVVAAALLAVASLVALLVASPGSRAEAGVQSSDSGRPALNVQSGQHGSDLDLLPGHGQPRDDSPLLVPAPGAPGGSVLDQRRLMVQRLAETHRIENRPVLGAMEQVPRHLFVPEAYRGQAYDDVPLPMGWGQTVYQPYIVALMTSLADLGPEDTVLEIGTGSGYHTAVLSRVAGKVYSIEISEPIADRARERLRTLGYDNIEIRVGDGYEGWAEKAPFDAVILTAAPPHLPQPLVDQLKVGGKMVAPVGEYFQDLRVITKTEDGLETEPVIPVRVSPMEGEVRDGSIR